MKNILDPAIAEYPDLTAAEQSHPRADGLAVGRERDFRPPVARRKRTNSAAGHRPRASIERHARKCAVCKHKDRADIESDFLHWHSPDEIICDYDIRNSAVLYRHAHATGLFNQRMNNIRYAAAHIVDRAETVNPTATAVLKAIRACTLINDDGQWIEPPTRIIRYEGDPATLPENQKPASAAQHDGAQRPSSGVESAPSGPAEPAISNRNLIGLENAVTPTKHSPEALSNRN